MASDGKHPLDGSHYDDITLNEYVLGQLLPDQEEAIRRHLLSCAACRAEVAEIEAFCRKLQIDLVAELERNTPTPQLSFDHIAAEWRKPPRRVALAYRLQQRLPNVSTIALLTVFLLAFVFLLPSGDLAALRSLELIEDYNGPPAMVAVTTDNGLVILHLDSRQPEVVNQFPHLTDPRNLQFSPDGQWLALQHGRTLHILQTTSPGIHLRIPLAASGDWSWSPDSRSLAYTDGSGALALFDTAEQVSRTIVPAEEHAWGMPVWTSDGAHIAYATVHPLPDESSTRTRQSLWRVTPASGYRVELAHNPNPDAALLVPAAWADRDSVLLAWDASAGAAGHAPALFRVDTRAHRITAVNAQSLAQGARLAWPVSPQGLTLAEHDDGLVIFNLSDASYKPLPEHVPEPHALEWAANGAWIAYTIPGMPEGKGLYLFALQDAALRPIELPGGAVEKAVFWAGIEHLFVIRQPRGSSVTELWLVSLTSSQPPQRILTNARLPQTGPYVGWRWQDVFAMQMLKPQR
ncbi:MAG: hypothetical protein GXY36_05435 [Chloroflexi bacterium]|nr:hypothetical protein [Chloroflexota bacterium]